MRKAGEGEGFDGCADILVLQALGVLGEDVVVDLLDGSFEHIDGPSDGTTLFAQIEQICVFVAHSLSLNFYFSLWLVGVLIEGFFFFSSDVLF